jgi:hypothetical protein
MESMYRSLGGMPYTERTTENIDVRQGAINPNPEVVIQVATTDFEFVGFGYDATVVYEHGLNYIPLFEAEARVVGTDNYRSVPYRESDSIEPDTVIVSELTDTSITLIFHLEVEPLAHELILYFNNEGVDSV